MDLVQLEAIESELGVRFRLKPGKRIAAKGEREAVASALQRIAAERDDVVALLRERDGEVEEIVEMEIATNIPSLAVQRENYVRWYSARSTYYHPTASQLEAMFSVLEEGDEVLPDFAFSFSVRKPNGLLVQVDRRGRISQPSPYSPHAQEQRK